MGILSRIMAKFHRPPAARSAVSSPLRPALPIAYHSALPIAGHSSLPIAKFDSAGTRDGLPVAYQLPEFSDYGTYDATNPGAETIPRWANPEMARFVNQWQPIQSSWIMALRFDPYPNTSDFGDMLVEFVDGMIAAYENVSVATFQEFAYAPSHGKWMYAWSRKSDYRTVRGTQYRGDALKARVEANK